MQMQKKSFFTAYCTANIDNDNNTFKHGTTALAHYKLNNYLVF